MQFEPNKSLGTSSHQHLLQSHAREGFYMLSAGCHTLVYPRMSPTMKEKERDMIVTHALTERGQLTILSASSPVLEESSLLNRSVTTLCLNRPKSLHTLNTVMCEALYKRIHQLQLLGTKCVILRSTSPGRAFCAGGDVRELCFLAERRQYDSIVEFFRTEFRLNSFLGCLQTLDTVSILDGIVMGGGVGLSVHGRFRVATENTVFSMPEAAIGFLPDVGASYFLSRLSPGLGAYISLTGAQLKGEMVLHAGLATHYVPHELISSLLESLLNTQVRSSEDIEAVLQSFSTPRSLSTENAQLLAAVKELFCLPSVEDIIKKVRETSSQANNIHRTFAAKCLRAMQTHCPMSLKLSFESLRRGYNMGLDDCLGMEFRLCIRLTRRGDFVRGVRAVLISKTKIAQWSPAECSDISDGDVAKFFRPLEDISVPELDLSHDSTTVLRLAQL